MALVLGATTTWAGVADTEKPNAGCAVAVEEDVEEEPLVEDCVDVLVLELELALEVELVVVGRMDEEVEVSTGAGVLLLLDVVDVAEPAVDVEDDVWVPGCEEDPSVRYTPSPAMAITATTAPTTTRAPIPLRLVNDNLHFSTIHRPWRTPRAKPMECRLPRILLNRISRLGQPYNAEAASGEPVVLISP